MKKETVLAVIAAILFLILAKLVFNQESKHPEHEPGWTNAPLLHP
jgi:hypothetical protein